MSEPQPSNGAETNGAKPAPAGLESLAAVGSRLAQLRETRGWTVDDVSARLKVAPQKLRALEAGDISHLPGVTFALGVVRSYAKMLGVDPEPFAQALRRERGVPEVDLSMPASSGTDLPRGRVSIPLGGSSRHHPWLWGTGIVVVAVVAVLMWHTGGDSSSLLARFKSGDAEHASAASAPAASSSSVEEAASSGASAVVANEVPAPAVASAAPAPAVASAAPAPAPVAPVVTAAASQPAVAAATASAAVPAQPASVVVAAGQSMIELKVKQDSWFSVRDKSGKELFSGLVHGGEAKQVAGDGPFKVTIGNKAGLDAIAFDGKPVDPAKYSAARGNVARFTLP
ncbi:MULTISPECIES: helix-turn-helix domain-containing protein [Burkholderia]|jgi:cytoskeleton protein RodZ|uniref:Helix-turn-helix domain-containing protein n=2 Tax=Burkholderia contaminans TaxID=488447 RepID=A0A1E3FR16_9BURK|nr:MULTISPECIES: helix-turn-helix domain-containing protein [Burkholderia]UTP23636.1 helix-turn-helix domain-containing protein [Burkholderia sp. FXe9]KKL43781.1 XRE family transcriptional regulator [Burkholderia contaminans LMG 23361]MBA9834006.1 helix-turn-helix domain-containing protein [Burkholderia contaminans]MBA9842230.1 helix-turn-helix domain-containing protein [Burkholderia contaminans]MBA9866978.1 helix-turn-helix domain-containing protein [Burkholderia contaminans]